MLFEVARNLVVVNGVDQFSPAQPMSQNNTAKASLVISANSATSLTVNLQGSNDLSNWSNSTDDTGYVVGYGVTANRALAFAYVRLKFTVVGTGTVVVNTASISTTQQ